MVRNFIIVKSGLKVKNFVEWPQEWRLKSLCGPLLCMKANIVFFNDMRGH